MEALAPEALSPPVPHSTEQHVPCDTVTVRVPGRGPLYMRLRRLRRFNVIVLHAWQPNSDGSPGPVEQACINAGHDPTVGIQVEPGWSLVGINDDEVDPSDFQGTIDKIKREQLASPRRLTFKRPAADSEVAQLYSDSGPSQSAMQRLKESGQFAASLGRSRLLAATKMLYSAEETTAQDTEKIRRSRVEQFSDLILEENIDLAALRSLTLQGVPEQGGFRPIVWRLLLGYLPAERARWREFLRSQRTLYRTFLAEVVPPEIVAAQAKALMRGGPKDPELYKRGENSLTQQEKGTILRDDSNESDAKKSMWDSYFKDAFLMEEIVKDVVRTYPDLHFYTSGMESANGTPEALAEVCERFLQSIVDLGVSESHYSALARILFVYAKLNPGIKYVQGMNEVLGTLYYVLARDPLTTDLSPAVVDNEEGADGIKNTAEGAPKEVREGRQQSELGIGRQSWVPAVEADAFFCFSMLMAEVRDLFTHQLDSSEQGIIGKMETLGTVLHRVDPLLANHLLESLHLEPSLYSLRWFTTLLCREFPLPDTIRLWDGLFSEDPAGRMDAVCYLCTAMVVMQRDQLLEGDFATCLRVLQSYPPTNVEDLIDLSKQLKEKDRKIVRRRLQQNRMNENIAKSLTTAERFLFGNDLLLSLGQPDEESQELESTANADIRAEIAEGFRAGFRSMMTAVRRTNSQAGAQAPDATEEQVIAFRGIPVNGEDVDGSEERVRVVMSPVTTSSSSRPEEPDPPADLSSLVVPIESAKTVGALGVSGLSDDDGSPDDDGEEVVQY